MATPVSKILLAILLLATPATVAPLHAADKKVDEKGADGVAKSSGPFIKLLDAGTGPKSVLRTKVEKGFNYALVMTIGMDMNTKLKGQELPVPKIPDQAVTMGLLVTDVAENGDITYDFKLAKAAVVDDPQNPLRVAGIMKDILKKLEGMAGKAVVTNRGITKTASFDIPDGLPKQLSRMLDSMSQSMHQVSSPVPEEAVGKGGKWSVVQTLAMSGLKIKQTATYEVVEIKGTTCKLKVDVGQNADPQEMDLPDAPEGLKIHLVSFDSKGSREMTLNTTTLFPVQSKTEVNVKQQIEIGDGDDKRVIDQAITMRMTLAEEKGRL